jgi:hypothetical protein
LNKQAKEDFLAIVKANKDATVSALIKEGTFKLGLKTYEAAEILYQLSTEGKISLEDPNPPKSFLKYAKSTYSLWFWGVIASVILTIASIYAFPQHPPYIYLRYVLGSIFVLYLPGYTLIEALYPKKEDLPSLERLALSIGLSLALTPLVGLALNYTPWGIRLKPILASLSLLTAFLALIALSRKFSRFKLIIEPIKPKEKRRKLH